MQFISIRYFALALIGLFLFTACEEFDVASIVSRNDLTEVNDLEEIVLRSDSLQTGMGGHCFDIVFPVTVEFPDGTTTIADSSAELRSLIDTWFANNDKKDGKPTIQLPFDVITNESQQTISDEDELRELMKECRPDRIKGHFFKGFFGKRGCYELLFPVSLSFPDGTTVAADSIGELKDLLKDWHENDSTNAGHPELVYPYDVLQYSDSTVITINSREELGDLMEECEPGCTIGEGRKKKRKRN